MDMSLVELSRKLGTGELRPADLVEESIRRIEKTNDVINAVVETRFEKARLEAAARDYSRTKLKGVPILLKSLGMNLEGEPATAGASLLAHRTAGYTDNFVQKILDLGFIVLGQTNTPEFGFKNITDPHLYGDTRHPMHPDHSPGGSSGGAAAALLSGMAPAVAASDGGGSIRIPASYCGLVGLKPSRGSMPVGPRSFRGWQGAAVNFFLTRTIAETRLLFDSMYTLQPGAPFASIRSGGENQLDEAGSRRPGRRLKIAYSIASPIGRAIRPAARAAVEKTVKLLEAQGHEVHEVAAPVDGLDIMRGYYFVNGVETASMLKGIMRDQVELITWCLYQYGLSLSGWEMVEALHQWDEAAYTMHRFHEEYDLYLTPTTADTAPRLDTVYYDEDTRSRMENIEHEADKYQVIWDMFEESLARTPYTMLANLTGQPAISLPLYRDADGFAIGAQFMAAKGREDLLFEVAEQLEEHFEMYD